MAGSTVKMETMWTPCGNHVETMDGCLVANVFLIINYRCCALISVDYDDATDTDTTAKV